MLIVTAPPVYGNTALLSGWANRGEHRFRWLALDEGHNDPAQFWNYVANALAQCTHPNHFAGRPTPPIAG
ncbi:MAG: hypothetical protein AB1649_22795 [Chloroflexota bacterium]